MCLIASSEGACSGLFNSFDRNPTCWLVSLAECGVWLNGLPIAHLGCPGVPT